MAISIVEKARDFAKKAHAKQHRDDGVTPYFTHVERVATKVAQLTNDQYVIAAAYLHDVVEDCDVALDQLDDEFSYEISGLVEFLTNRPIKENETQTEADNRRSFDNIRIGSGGPKVWLIKLCDRLDNVSSINNKREENGWNKKRILSYVKKTRNLIAMILQAELSGYFGTLSQDMLNLIKEIEQRIDSFERELSI